MKRSGGDTVFYAAWALLLMLTVLLGGVSGGMAVNYLFLAMMGVLLYRADRHGLAQMRGMTDDLKHIADKLLGDRSYQQFMEEMREQHMQASPDELTAQNEAMLAKMGKLHFTRPSAEEDWQRLLKDWQASEGMACDAEDYLCEGALLDDSNYSVCAQMPGVLTALGILGTFLGLVLGLRSFDFSNADQMSSSVEALVGGLNVAFYTSIYGVSLSILYNVCMRRRTAELSQALNQFYDVFRTALKPVDPQAVVARFGRYQDQQNQLLQDMRELMDQRFGERLAERMAETLTPVFDRINQSLDHVIMDFHKEQAASLEKIVDAFVAQMSGALNAHVQVLGDSVDQLSEAQKQMTGELQQLMGQIARTGTDTARINEQAGEILQQLAGYVPQLEQSARDSAAIIAQMEQWSGQLQGMSQAQQALLCSLEGHEQRLSESCVRMNDQQEALNERLADFVRAAEVLAQREQDPMQYEDLKEMLTAYMNAMQQLQQDSAQQLAAAMTQALAAEKPWNSEAWQAAQAEQAEERRAMLAQMTQQTADNQRMLEQMAQQTQEGRVARQQQDQDRKKLGDQLEKITKAQEDMVYLNGRMAGMMSGQNREDAIRLPSQGGRSAQEQWMQEQNARMDAWMARQEAFQRQLLQMEAHRQRSLLTRIREFFTAG